MSHDDPASRSTDAHASGIRAARAQVEAARLRQQRLGGRHSAPGAHGTLPRLPRYTILRELHRGGQGVVYLAVQESTDRRVAVKILNRGPLADSAAGLARFEREVEALSLLKHPNIVTIHDCGRDHDHVYLVMDYVNGRPLDAYVDGERIPLADTLALFARICDGVNAAHLRGIIHRDLKPGNLLVDERGEPHVLDFGLAKLVNEPVRPDSAVAVMTETGQFVGSLPWASPEQAEGRSDQLDIRTDVYSLGVVLYQVLTGSFPYPVTGHLVEVARHISQTPPTRPSTIQSGIDRELETILLKCLAKEPDRRYQIAGEVARDLRRYLAGEPIEARRDSLAYVMAKRLERYRVVAVAAATILAVVTGALIVSLTLWRRAERQGALARESVGEARASAVRADTEAEQARAITDFMREVLTSAQPENQGADVRLVQVLAGASATASQRFSANPQQEAQVRDLLGLVYDSLALWDQAGAEHRRAAALWNSFAGPDDPRTLSSQCALAGTLINLTRTPQAEQVLQDLVPRLERIFGPDDPRTLGAHRCVALTQLYRGQVDEAERTLLALRTHPRLTADDQAQVRLLSGLIAVHTNRASIDDLDRRRAILTQAQALAVEWIERSTRLAGPDALVTLQARVKWAELAGDLGQFQASAAACREVLAGSAERLGPCHHLRSQTMHVLAEALNGLGEEAEAGALALQRLECLRQRLPANDIVLLASISDGLRYLERAGLATEGEGLARQLSAGLATFGGGHGDMGYTAEPFIASFVSMQHRFEEAESLFRPLLATEERLPDDRTRARLHAMYGSHLARWGHFEDAERELQRAASGLDDIRRGTWDSHPDDVIVAFIALYQAWDKPEKVAEYQTLRREVRRR
jgi:eukaryotic-like serine/threonine-protein kinase